MFRYYSKKDGTGNFTKVNDALEYAKTLNKKVNINIYSGEYDVLEELGGQTWIDSLTDANGERQGLQLYDNVKLIGHGDVIIKLIMPDSITKKQSTLILTINTFGNGGFENIHFIAKNTRYVCHDEMNNQTHNINRYVNNCIFEHLGNKETLWEYYTAYVAEQLVTVIMNLRTHNFIHHIDLSVCTIIITKNLAHL